MSTKYYNKYWNQQLTAKSHHSPPVWTKSNLEYHLKFFKLYIQDNILDIGCGNGTFLNFITKNSKSSKAVGIDLVTPKKSSSNYKFIQSSAESIPLPNNSLNTVFAIEVLEHLVDIDSVFDEVHRILKPGGFFCITTTDFNLPKKLIISLFFWDRFFYPSNPHIRFFTKNTLVDIADYHGFRLTKYQWNRSYFGLMPQGQMVVFQKHV